MSLFAESSWEANTLGDKLSKDIFHKSKKGGKINKSRTTKNGSLKKNPISLKNVEQSAGKKLTTNHAKRRAKKTAKAVADGIANGEITPTKWTKKSKEQERTIVPKTSPTKKQERSGKQGSIAVKRPIVAKSKPTDKQKKFSKSVQQPVDQETKSQRRRKKKKLRKIAETQTIDISKVVNGMAQTTGKKPSSRKSLNIQRLETMLANKEKTANGESKEVKAPESLRDRMMSQLRGSRFRFLNETLYNNVSSESKKYFKEDPDAFTAYHAGYRQQVEQWPLNPLDVIISAIKKMPKEHIVADFGCGEARLAESVSQKVHSFDLVAVNDNVKACDMAHTPLLTTGVNVVVFCLSLMGTNLADYLLEANRVLKKDGILKIADVESRFENIDEFITLLASYGFVNTWKDLSHNLFYFMDFKKASDVNRSTKNLPQIALKACVYKKR